MPSSHRFTISKIHLRGISSSLGNSTLRYRRRHQMSLLLIAPRFRRVLLHASSRFTISKIPLRGISSSLGNSASRYRRRHQMCRLPIASRYRISSGMRQEKSPHALRPEWSGTGKESSKNYGSVGDPSFFWETFMQYIYYSSSRMPSRIADTDRYAGDSGGVSSRDFPAITSSATYGSSSIFPPYGRPVSVVTRSFRLPGNA
jgi:hypothetical protein